MSTDLRSLVSTFNNISTLLQNRLGKYRAPRYFNHFYKVLRHIWLDRDDPDILSFWLDTTSPLISLIPQNYFNKYTPEFRAAYPNYADIFDILIPFKSHNFIFPKIKIPSPFNVAAWKKYLGASPRACEFLQFLSCGFPTGADLNFSNTGVSKNHNSATSDPKHVRNYLQTEVAKNTLLGPFNKPMCDNYHISPLMTAPKPNSEFDRTIVDHSFAEEGSVSLNSQTNKLFFAGRSLKLFYPHLYDVALAVHLMGPGVTFSSIDLKAAFRHARIDLLDAPFTSLFFEGKYYMDVSCAFGATMSAVHMQMISCAFAHICHKKGICVFVFSDDFLIISPSDTKAESDLQFVIDLAAELGLSITAEKTVTPSKMIKWIGIIFFSSPPAMCIPAEKIAQALKLTQIWLRAIGGQLKAWQKLAGKLLFCTSLIPGARIFLSRIYDRISIATRSGYALMDDDIREDLSWYQALLTDYNALSINHFFSDYLEIYTDSCLISGGGFHKKDAFAFNFAELPQQLFTSINIKEAFAVIVALVLHINKFQFKHIRVYIDNTATVNAFQSAKPGNSTLRLFVRALWVLLAKNHVFAEFIYFPGVQNGIADRFSRSFLSQSHFQSSRTYATDTNMHLTFPCTLPIYNAVLQINWPIYLQFSITRCRKFSILSATNQ